MPRPTDREQAGGYANVRERFLADTVDYIDECGVADLSLRPLAAALGTSSRMLIYYFGTKDELLTEALATVRPRYDGLFIDVHDAHSLGQALHALWQSTTEGDHALGTRVLLQVMGTAVSGPQPLTTDGAGNVITADGNRGRMRILPARAGMPESFNRYASDTVMALVTAIDQALCRIGVPQDTARTDATTLAAGLRGLLLDRIVTGDIERTAQAATALIDRMVSQL